ncbi:cold-shock protein [Rhizobium binxianense]
MINGTVKNFDPIKGYGFILPSDGSLAVFFHAETADKAGIANLTAGQKLEFSFEFDIRGRRSVTCLKCV